MAYYMQVFVEGQTAPTLSDLRAAYLGSSAQLLGNVIQRGDECYGILSISIWGDNLFEGELDEFRESLENVRWNFDKMKVQRCLNSAVATVTVQVVFGDREIPLTLSHIDPLFNWLRAHYSGLIQADGEGFYDGSKLIVKFV